MLGLNASLKLTKREFKIATLADLERARLIRVVQSKHRIHIILITGAASNMIRELLLFSVSVFLWNSTASRSKKRKRKNKFDQYSAILISQSVNNAYE